MAGELDRVIVAVVDMLDVALATVGLAVASTVAAACANLQVSRQMENSRVRVLVPGDGIGEDMAGRLPWDLSTKSYRAPVGYRMLTADGDGSDQKMEVDGPRKGFDFGDLGADTEIAVAVED